MIVADVNLLAYLLIEGDFTEHAERVFARDRRWVAPRWHKAEFLNILATNLRSRKVRPDAAEALWRKSFRLVATAADNDPMDVLNLSVQSRISTYDCEYVLVAKARKIRLVTNDSAVLKAFPDVAVSVVDFAAGK